ncbi:MAG TPA: hypothetical protein VM638_05605 [Actinomycetota bacterium]|nr:hypothetical protein [Actinomycetota bacterium]
MTRELVERYWRATAPPDEPTLRRLRHPGWTMEWPQSGERIVGHQNAMAIMEAYPGFPDQEIRSVQGTPDRWTVSPMMIPVRISGGGNAWFVETALEYPEQGSWQGVAITELREGLVWRDIMYFVEPFEAPEWRGEITERAPDRASEPSLAEGDGNEEARRATLARYAEHVAGGDLPSAARELFHEDAVEDIPQSGERIRGMENQLAMIEHHPTRPTGGVRRIFAAGNQFAWETDLDYEGERWLEVVLATFRGDKVTHAIAYFAQPFEAPEWRARWVERMDLSGFGA